MLHSPDILKLADLEFRACTHKATPQRYAVLPKAGSIEVGGAISHFRAGDVLVESVDGVTLYDITPEEFAAAFDVGP